MFLNQCVYYNDGIDTYPVQIKKCMPKTVLVECPEFTKRVKKTSCKYQECDGGFIDFKELENLIQSNSNDIPKKWIMNDNVHSFDHMCSISSRKATNADYAIYPQVILNKYL
jgi:hypothetical protein